MQGHLQAFVELRFKPTWSFGTSFRDHFPKNILGKVNIELFSLLSGKGLSEES